MSNIPSFAAPIVAALYAAKRKLTKLSGGGDIVKKGGAFGDLLNDTDIRADRVIGMYLQKAYAKLPNVARVSVEGLDDLNVRNTGMWICVDPVDGSLNYKQRGRLIGNPYTAVVTVLSKVDDPLFDDVIFAAILDLRPKSTDLWCAWRERGGLGGQLNRETLYTSIESVLDPGSQIIMTETYYPKNREALLRLFDGQKGNYSRLGSAAYEMALVSSGNAIAFICCSQKNHELGAAQLLVRAGGGTAIDWEGTPIELLHYDFRTQTPIILAANGHIAEQILKRIRAFNP